MTKRGRPPKPEGALTPAERKAAQRERDRAALLKGRNVAMEDVTTGALIEGLPALMTGRRRARLAAVLMEIGRRGGVTVTV